MFLFDESLETFKMFGLSHILAILFIITLFVLIIIYRDRVNETVEFHARKMIAFSMVFFEIIFISWNILRSGFDTSLLPLGLCATSMLITSLALWTKNLKLFKFIFPWAVIGALISLVVANMTFEFPHFRYFHYFFNHGFFLLANLYFLINYRIKLSYKDLWFSGGILLIYVAIMYPFNLIFDDNHLFLMHIPTEAEPLYAFLGDYWLFGFLFSIFLLFHIIYFSLRLFSKWLYTSK